MAKLLILIQKFIIRSKLNAPIAYTPLFADFLGNHAQEIVKTPTQPQLNLR